MLVKRILLVLHEDDVYRQDINVLLDFIAQPLCMIQTGCVLLCRDDELGRGQGSKLVVDELHVLFAKLVMVGKRER